MQTIWAEQALLSAGWAKDVSITVDASGVVSHIQGDVGAKQADIKVGILVPAPANIHSHAFQRAMAGMTEHRGPNPGDNFWAWRKLMYRFMAHLLPQDVEAITAFVQMEMLEAGFGSSVEFHYLHHGPDGVPYDNLSEMSERVVAAARISGVGLTLLPVLYERGGCDGRALGPRQARFGNNFDRFCKLVDGAKKSLENLPDDARLGIAPHSLRAVSRESLAQSVDLMPEGPFHIHIAEQVGEVEEVKTAYGKRPVDWLYDSHPVDARWCLIHATQMEQHETEKVAASGAVAGLCPITEANLGDGIFDGVRYFECGGAFGIGSDSNIRITLSEELRQLEYSQRLLHKGRAMLATETKSAGRVLLEGAAKGGALAAGRNCGAIKVGCLADLVALNIHEIDLLGKQGDTALDTYIFAGDDRWVSDVWSGGRHVVKAGHHINRVTIASRYRDAMTNLRAKM